ncbi:MAG: type I DNA topoisomerase [Bacilli bacterium]|nr:type I DNA topoisomerase [Bacilli bacterium]
MKLIIVESPTKAKTIQKYLGNGYKVVASKGHIRDLAFTGEKSLGVDVKNNFAPDYVTDTYKIGTINYLKKLVDSAEDVYLATDPDREGEAIAWHLADVLGLDINTTKRLEFHEITKKTVLEAIEKPRTIDMNLVSSQETRRILDRIIGFELSGLLQKKIYTRSAGRVQSVALKLIVDRQKEIDSFVVETSYGIKGKLTDPKIEFELVDNEKLQPVRVNGQDELNEVLKVKGKGLTLQDIVVDDTTRYAKPPFTTSSLQQEAFSQFHFSASKTSQLAQKLYEGVSIGEETTGLITYMRTDSIRLSPLFIYTAKEYIKNELGEDYVGVARVQKEDSNVQDAHEAIRPTKVELTPEKVKEYLGRDEYKLYKLIWTRAVASIVKPSIIATTKNIFTSDNYTFVSKSSELKFDGYKKLYAEYEKEKYSKPKNMIIDNVYSIASLDIEEHNTRPPYKYSEGSLIKDMEELGIGRPSTYASTIDSLKKSAYISIEKNYISPTLNGLNASIKLDEFFSDIVNVEYTANMEKGLDLIAEGEKTRLDALNAFYAPFEEKMAFAYKNMTGANEIYTDEICPKCGGRLVKKQGRYGEYVCCENKPRTCDYVKPKEVTISEHAKDCPKCKEGKLVVRKGKYGNFLGCSRYPECDYMEAFKKTTYYKKK